MSETPEYHVWQSLKQRCSNPSAQYFPRYGGRGIENRFRDFAHFIGTVGRRPSSKHSIGRIDNNGHYEPGNVEWQLPIPQARNMSSNVTLTHNGVTRCIAEWSEITGINPNTLYQRHHKGWSDADVLTRPIRKATLTHNGLTQTILEWAEITKIPASILYSRVAKGWPANDVLTRPIRKTVRSLKT